MCDEIRLALAEVRRRTPSAEPAWGPRGTTPRLTVRGTAAGAPPPPPPPHCLGAADSATSAMHCLTALGQWAVQLLQYTAALPGGSGQCNSCNAMPHCPGGSGQCNSNSCHAPPHCLGAVGGATSSMHGLTAWGQWAVQLLQCTASVPWGQWEVEVLQCTASLPGGSGQCNSCNALPHCLGAVGSGTPAMHRLNAWGQWVVQLLQCTASLPCGQWAAELLQCTASLPGGCGQWNSCNALPHCPGGSGQRNSCNALPHCLGAVGSGTPAMHCLTALGQRTVQLLQCTASLLWGSGQ